jgi:formate hydrogenlyase subunit 3/multisubunit Na+/H+ antiporter MnhD subunit
MGSLIAAFPWIVWPILVPLVGATLTFVVSRRTARLVAIATSISLTVTVCGLLWQVSTLGVQHHTIGGWGVPLGIDLRADGFAVLMVFMSALVGTGVSIYALGYFANEAHGNNHETEFFWPLWLFLWGALHALFLSADLFNIYVTLELISLSAVALVTVAGQPSALIAGMRYLLASFLGSMLYLLGVALLYAAFGTLDMADLKTNLVAGPVVWVVMPVMAIGLALKTALFPLHFWLPAAHASAPAPVSALLSALVVKASFYLFLRLWFEVFFTVVPVAAGHLLAALGASAILWGSYNALRQQRLKLLVAYSTVAQIGYLFLLFPLTTSPATGFLAWSGGIYHALSHAVAKAAMFLAAGTMMHVRGHDRISEFAGIGQQAPLAMFAFALAGVSLMGLPPSGGFVAKWLLLVAAWNSGQWWWALVMIVGGLLAAAYLLPVMQHAFTTPPATDVHPIPQLMEMTSVLLAVVAIVLGLIAIQPLALLEIGSPLVSGIGAEGKP